jgi:transglutaminase-like putative cysteine protease
VAVVVGHAVTRWLSAAACAALLALAAGAAGRLYHGPLFVELVAGAAAGSVLIGRVFASRPQWIIAPLSVVALLGYLGFAVWWSAKASGLPGPVGALALDAVRNGGPRLLTALVPMEAQPDTVLLPIVLVWLAGLVSAELAVRAGRALPALLPPVIVYAAALWFAGPHGDAEPWRALAFVAVAAASLVDGHGPLVVRARPAVWSLVFFLAAAAVVPAVARAAPDRPADPRGAVVPPELDTLDANPLARISGWLQNPGRPLLDVTMSTDARLTLAVLTEFDGVTWKAGGTYRDAGRRLPVSGPAAATDEVQEQITVRELTGRLVPAVVAAREVTGMRVAVDEDSGTLLRPDGLRPGVTYSVVSAKPRVDVNQQTIAAVPADARFLGTGEYVPDDLKKLADTIAAESGGGAHQRAFGLQRFLAEHYTAVTDAPSGHAYPNLRFFLLGPRQDGGQSGTSEQFAAAFAVLGRLMGLPTRVVVGFPASAGRSTVRAGDALAWPEVLFDGLGWVSYNPMPSGGQQRRPLEQDYRPRPDPPSPSPSVSPSTLEPRLPASPSSAPVPRAAPSAPPWPLAGALAGLLVAAPAAVAAARLGPTRRRRRGRPAERVRGAWLDVVDALVLAGRRGSHHETVGELAAARPDLPPIRDLAALVNLAGFAPFAPTEAGAATAREQANRYVRAARAAAPRWRRLVWWLHPAPLRRR